MAVQLRHNLSRVLCRGISSHGEYVKGGVGLTKQLVPVFAGETDEGDEIILYQLGDEFHLLRPDGEVHALSPGSEISWWQDADSQRMHLKVQSPQWTGMANGSRAEFIRAEPRPA